jgi:hypothetical protein
MNYPRRLPKSSLPAFGASQDVSVVSIPGGKTVGFW